MKKVGGILVPDKLAKVIADKNRPGHQRVVMANARDAHSDNAAKFQCWRVEFEWEDQFDITSKKAVFFVRAPNHALSGVVSAKLWAYWVKQDPFEEFPKMNNDSCQTFRIPEAEYQEIYKKLFAADPRIHIAGNPINPRCFWSPTISANSKYL